MTLEDACWVHVGGFRVYVCDFEDLLSSLGDLFAHKGKPQYLTLKNEDSFLLPMGALGSPR